MYQNICQAIFLFSFTWCVSLAQEKCDVNSDWQTPCERSCDNRYECQAFPNQNCHCREGFFRNRLNGKCVTHKNCPSRTVCPSHSTRQSNCEVDCGSGDCFKKSSNACHCSKNYYRNPLTYKCVRRKHCPKTITTRCPKNSSTQFSCEKTCAIPVCKKRHGLRCFCKPGTYRNLITGRCDKYTACPMRTCSPKLKCERTCGKNACRNVTRDCYCTKNFFRDPLTMKCVRKASCFDPSHTTDVPEKGDTEYETDIPNEVPETESIDDLQDVLYIDAVPIDMDHGGYYYWPSDSYQ